MTTSSVTLTTAVRDTSSFLAFTFSGKTIFLIPMFFSFLDSKGISVECTYLDCIEASFNMLLLSCCAAQRE